MHKPGQHSGHRYQRNHWQYEKFGRKMYAIIDQETRSLEEMVLELANAVRSPIGRRAMQPLAYGTWLFVVKPC